MFGDIGLALKVAGRLIAAVRTTAKALRKDSPGGKKITKRERQKILHDLAPVLEEVVDEIIDEME
jgi:hypothetical protein